MEMSFAAFNVAIPETVDMQYVITNNREPAGLGLNLADIDAAQNARSDEEELIQDDDHSTAERYLKGWRLCVSGFGLGLSLFLPALEVSVVSTALVSIASDLEGLSQSSWIVTAYLLTYTGFLIIWSKITDLVGLKPSLLGSMLLFMGFSGGCGGAQTINQLIIFRAFQGIGGAGVYGVTTIGLIQLVPSERYKTITAIASSIMTSGLIVGPLIGGVITNSHHWRWVFILNLPAGAVALVISMIILPSHFPRHAETLPEKQATDWAGSRFFEKADVVGAFLLLGASVLLVAALSEGNVQFAWNSGVIISLFVVSAVFWALFLAWERIADGSNWTIEPMWPWRFLRNRIWIGVLFGCFLLGAPLTVAVINLPQRYQLANDSTPLHAGMRLLPFAAMTPIGVVTSTMLIGRARISFILVLILGIVLQTVGYTLLSTVPTTVQVWNGQYGYSVIAGLGTGVSIGSVYMLAPIVVEERDQALAIGSTLQARMLGGAVGIAVVNSVFNSYLRSHLEDLLSNEQVDGLLSSASNIGQLSPSIQETVRNVYGEGYNWQMRVTIAFSAAQALAAMLMWKKKQLRLNKEGLLELG